MADEIRIEKPFPVDRESKRGPSIVLSLIFTLGLAVIVVPLVFFVGAIAVGSQWGLNVATVLLKWGMVSVAVVLTYGAAVGIYHTFLAMTGLDRGARRE
jgi:uncharacterized sodium:solute symporter family permease YidK